MLLLCPPAFPLEALRRQWDKLCCTSKGFTAVATLHVPTDATDDAKLGVDFEVMTCIADDFLRSGDICRVLIAYL